MIDKTIVTVPILIHHCINEGMQTLDEHIFRNQSSSASEFVCVSDLSKSKHMPRVRQLGIILWHWSLASSTSQTDSWKHSHDSWNVYILDYCFVWHDTLSWQVISDRKTEVIRLPRVSTGCALVLLMICIILFITIQLSLRIGWFNDEPIKRLRNISSTQLNWGAQHGFVVIVLIIAVILIILIIA